MQQKKETNIIKIFLFLFLLFFIIFGTVITTVIVVKLFLNNPQFTGLENSPNNSVSAITEFDKKDTSVINNQTNSDALKIIQNNFGKEAIAAGAYKCAVLYSSLGETMVLNSNYEITTFLNKNLPDKHAISGLVGQFYPEQNLYSSGVVFAVPVEGGCEGTMMRTVVTKNSCEQIANNQLPKNAQKQKILSGTSMYQLPSGVNILLTPISKELCAVVTSINLADIK